MQKLIKKLKKIVIQFEICLLCECSYRYGFFLHLHFVSVLTVFSDVAKKSSNVTWMCVYCFVACGIQKLSQLRFFVVIYEFYQLYFVSKFEWTVLGSSRLHYWYISLSIQFYVSKTDWSSRLNLIAVNCEYLWNVDSDSSNTFRPVLVIYLICYLLKITVSLFY